MLTSRIVALTAVLALGLGACSQSQLDSTQAKIDGGIDKVQQTAANIDPAVTAGCGDAMALVPVASLAGPAGASIAGYATAGCKDAEAMLKLAGDPSSADWLKGLVAQMKSLIPVKAG